MEPSAVVAAVYVDRWPELPVDATVTGPPVPLYRWLWGRGPDDELTVQGEASAVRQLDARLRVATQ